MRGLPSASSTVAGEVYAAREKSGVYIPKERYYQEETERKAMADQIEQMGIQLENEQKRIEELQDKYVDQVKQCSDLTSRLETTEVNLSETRKLLANTQGELRKCQYSLSEKDFIISEQIKAENALALQACVLRSELEKALKDNASLFQKIGREDKLNADNRDVVSNFQVELNQQIVSLSKMLTSSISKQSEHLLDVEKLCNSFLETHDTALLDLKKKLATATALYVSHFEAVQNVVSLHKASSNAALEDISVSVSANMESMRVFLSSEGDESASVFNSLQTSLSTYQGEMAVLARELRQRFNSSMEQTKNVSEFINEVLQRLSKEVEGLQNHSQQFNDVQTESIASFQKAYEEQSKTDAEKLIADVSTLVYDHIRKQKEMVDARLVCIRENTSSNKAFLDGHVSVMDGITSDAKRKWHAFATQAEGEAKDSSDYSAAKHCRMESLLKQCVSTAESAFERCKQTQESLTRMGTEHASAVISLARNASDNNEQHGAEIDSTRVTAEHEVARNSEDIIQHTDSLSVEEQECISRILCVVKCHQETLETLTEDHSNQAMSINTNAEKTFQQRYLDYEPTGATPTRTEQDIPSKGSIDSLRAMPMEALMEEFRENNSYESFELKEPKPSLIPRLPLTQIN